MLDSLIRLFAVLLLWGPGSALVQAQGIEALAERFESRVEAGRSQLIEVRRDIHRHPEISGEEERTARVVAERLRRLGFDVRTGVGGHGVVGVLRGGKAGAMVAFRADMDAVRSSAPDPVEFRSQTPGVRHICGHDVHTTIGLALAEGLSGLKDELPGSVMLIFQPAEENATGARAMLAADVFGDLKPQAIFAVHTAPMNVGQMATAGDTLMAWRDRVRVTVSGQGDLDQAAVKIRDEIQAVGTLTPQQAVQPSPRDGILVNSSLESPTASGERVVVATISTANPDAKRLVEERLGRLALEKVSVNLDYQQKWIAGVTNDPALVEKATRSAQAVLGEGNVALLQQVVPAFSEDFGSFQQRVRGHVLSRRVQSREGLGRDAA